MTEYEIADLTTSIMGNYLTAFSIFITIISAYIITAFVAGSRLSRSQVIFVNLCFIATTSLLSFLCATILARALELNLQSSLADVSGPSWGANTAYLNSGILHVLIMVGAIWFMWRVRNKGS